MPVLLDGIGRRQHGFHFFISAKVAMLAVDFAVFHHPVRRDEEAVFIDVAVDRK